jgi:CheY-like chemotaxis protein
MDISSKEQDSIMQNKTVLVVEDNELNMKLVRAFLEFGKYQILEAGDAETGIRLALEHQPDLILMDIQLPGMDGLSATRVIKKDPALMDIPVVAFTGYAMAGDKETAKEAGCAGHITKPILLYDFLKAVARFLKHDTCNEQCRKRDT